MRLALVVAGALLTLAVQAGNAGTFRSQSMTFTDPAGDAGTAADIASVTVSNDSSGQITFVINFANTPSTTDALDIYIDSDQRASTGDPREAGTEWDLYQDFSNNTWDLGAWNGSSWAEASSSSTVRVGHTANQLTMSVNKSEIGAPTAFNFWVDSYDGSGGAAHEDVAPDGTSVWSYELATLQLKALFVDAAKTAKAGKDYAAGIAVQRSDTGVFLGPEGQLDCTATIGAKSLSPTLSQFLTITYKGAKVSAGVCIFRIPKSAKGKTMHGTITASYQGAQVARTFTTKIR